MCLYNLFSTCEVNINLSLPDSIPTCRDGFYSQLVTLCNHFCSLFRTICALLEVPKQHLLLRFRQPQEMLVKYFLVLPALIRIILFYLKVAQRAPKSPKLKLQSSRAISNSRWSINTITSRQETSQNRRSKWRIVTRR